MIGAIFILCMMLFISNLFKRSSLAVAVFYLALVCGAFFSVQEVRAADYTIYCSGTLASPTPVTESNYTTSDNLTFLKDAGDGYCELDEPLSVATVEIGSDNEIAFLTHASEDSDGVTITTTGDFTIFSGSGIDVDEKGCAFSGTGNGYGPDLNNVCTFETAGYGAGASTNRGVQGGGYGGLGGAGSALGAKGVAYGSVTAPVLFGSSGGGNKYADGGAGGGLVILDIGGNFSHNGTITANGQDGIYGGNSNFSSGGGSGGAIYVQVTGSFSGSTGDFSVNGGDGLNGGLGDGGGGGGGRISLIYSSNTFASFDSDEFSASGGLGPDSADAGLSGTVHVKDSSTNDITAYHGFEFDTDLSANSFTVGTSSSNLYCDGSTDTTPSLSVTNGIILKGAFDCTDSDVIGFDTAAGTSVELDGLTFSMNGISDAGALTPYAMVSWTMNDAVSVTLQNSTVIYANVQWTNISSLSIDSTSAIDANELGCTNPSSSHGYGPDNSNVCTQSLAGFGRGASTGGVEGAGHGGAGGAGSATGGDGATYGSEAAPVLLGSSGGSNNYAYGGTGGGLIYIVVDGNVLHSGTLTADGGDAIYDGNDNHSSGGGSGGSIFLTVNGILSGVSGKLSADGGDGLDGGLYDGGGGGGGRISVLYQTDSSDYLAGFTAAGVAVEGAGPGGAVDGSIGTFYTEIAEGGGGAGVPEFSTVVYLMTLLMIGYYVHRRLPDFGGPATPAV